MAKRLRILRSAAGALILGAAGCAFPNGSTGGDPLLGSFNRPIVATPPPERGGLGPDTPAYDGGARIGVGAPDVPQRGETPTGPLPAPAPGTSPSPGTPGAPGTPSSPGTPGSPGSPTGARLPTGGPDVSIASRPATSGAQLPMPTDSAARLPAPPPLAPRLLPELGELSSPSVRTVGHEEPIESSRVPTIEELQFNLQKAGARDLRTEQSPNGEWLFDCTINGEAYQGRGRNALEAVRLVWEQLQKSNE
jgi:hypothetical protein